MATDLEDAPRELAALARGERESFHLSWGRARDRDRLGRLVVAPGVGFRDGELGMELFLEELYE